MQKAKYMRTVSAQNSLLLPLWFLEGYFLAFSSLKIVAFRLDVPLSTFQRQFFLQKDNIMIDLNIYNFYMQCTAHN